MSARSKNLWTLLGAAVVAAGLGLYAWLGVMKGEEKEAEQKRAAERLVQPVSRPDGGTENVRYDHLVVKAKGDTTELGRLPDQSWVISRPFKAPGNQRIAEDIVGTLQHSPLKATVEDAPSAEDLKRYGLDAPAVEVTASASGVPPLTLRVGNENPYNQTVYVQRAGDPKVYAMDAVARASLEKNTFDLRDRAVVAVRDLGITRIEVKGRKHSWTLARDPGQPYAFVRPSAEPADTGAVSRWIGELHAFNATHFIDDSPAERKRVGLDKPDVEVVFQQGTTETVRIRAVAGKKDSDPAHVLREDGSGVTLAEVPRGAIAALDKGPAELRDRTVLHAKPEEVSRIRIGTGGAALVVERDRPADGGPESWHLVGPAPARADNFKAASLLYGLTALKAEPTEEKLPSDAKTTGLGATARTVVLEGQDGKPLGSIGLGSTSKKPAGTFVRDDRGRVVVVDSARLKDIPSKPADLAPPPPPPAAAGVDAGS